ncbi:MAG TPA: DUF3426 domain-containing protein, partial [Xanthomonadaceae bacterium]|nr:DUF3426 domain-containing protein [Xanthomonadaceae bacterium]
EHASTPEPLAARACVVDQPPEQPGLFDPPAGAPPPFMVPRPRVAPDGSRRTVLGVCALLALLLGAQLVYATHQSRIDHDALRRMLIALCQPLGCTPLPHRDIDAIALVSRDVRHHPTVEGALLITANLANRSDLPVALPVIEIVLADLSERRIAMRRFRAAEYAPDPDLQRRGLQPGSVLPVAFEVEDPGRDAVAFSFAFH